MRLELAGSLVLPKPLVKKFNANTLFDVASYIDMGYTHFDVICIGAGGGMGGGIDTAGLGTAVRNYGGAGGGGGFHRVRGLLSALPSSCPVVVGVGGAVGNDHSSNAASTTDGSDGGYSSFNTDTCKASGGKGGKRAKSNSLTVTTDADGGDGGVGKRTIAGGGAAGGQAGIPTSSGPDFPGTDGTDGTFFQNVGQGGGGGAGGVGKYGTGTTHNAATSGGRGAYNPGNTAVYGPGDTPGNDTPSGAQNIVPGGASGAKASPVNGLPTVYGQSKGEKLPGDPGTVIIRLTAE
jgi:hypothetical protein